MVNVRFVRAREMLSPTKLGSDYVINPYVGCPHRCLYCYVPCLGRTAPHDEAWGDFLDVRQYTKTPDLARLYRKSVLFSSMTDAYNPYEEKAEATLRLLRAILPAQPSVTIITKSALITRDIPLLLRFPYAKAVISFSSLDDSFRRRFEPHAASPQDKLLTLRRLHEAGIRTTVFVAPLFPGITDWRGIVEAAAPYADNINFDSLHLRAQNRESVLAAVAAFRPDLAGFYDSVFRRGERGCWNALKKEIDETCRSSGIRHSIFF